MFNALRAEIYHMRHRHALRRFLMMLTAGIIVAALVHRVAFDAPEDLQFYSDFLSTLLTISTLPLSMLMVLMIYKGTSVQQQLLTIHRNPVHWLLRDYVSAVFHSILAMLILCVIGFVAGLLIVGGSAGANATFAKATFRLAFVLVTVLLPLNAMAIAIFEWIENRAIAVVTFFAIALLLPTAAQPLEAFNNTVAFLFRLAPFWLVFDIFYDLATLRDAVMSVSANLAFWLGLAAVHRLRVNR